MKDNIEMVVVLNEDVEKIMRLAKYGWTFTVGETFEGRTNLFVERPNA